MEPTHSKKSYLFYKSHNFVGQFGLSGIGPKKWQRRWVVLYPDSLQGRVRLECYDSREQEAKDPSSKKTIALGNCQSIQMVKQKSQEFAFDVTTSEKVHSFATESGEELQGWLQALWATTFGSKDVSSGGPPGLSSSQSQDSIDQSQENFIYESVIDAKVFSVEMKPSQFPDTSCPLEGGYQLHVGTSTISLHQPSPGGGQSLFQWPLKYLRRYGRNETMFSLEAGRRCESGPGKFFFATSEGNEIFNAVQSAVENLSQQGGANPPPAQPATATPKPAALPGPVKAALPTLPDPAVPHSPNPVADKSGPAAHPSPGVAETGRTSSSSGSSNSFMANLNRKLGAMMTGGSSKSAEAAGRSKPGKGGGGGGSWPPAQELVVYEDPAGYVGDDSASYELAGTPSEPLPDDQSAATAYDHLDFFQGKFKPPVPKKPGQPVEEHTYDLLNPDDGGEQARRTAPPVAANNDGDNTYDTIYSGQ